MLNFAEQTGSGAVIVVWYYLPSDTFAKYIYPATNTHTMIFRLLRYTQPHIYTLTQKVCCSIWFIYSKIDAFVARLHTANTQQRTINIQMILVGGIDRVHSSRHPVPNKSLQSVFFLKVLLFFCCLPQSSLRFNLTWLVFRICETTVLDWKKERSADPRTKPTKQTTYSQRVTQVCFTFPLWLVGQRNKKGVCVSGKEVVLSGFQRGPPP